MEIWRRRTDGFEQQVTDNASPNLCPHPSPDGKWLVFYSYENRADLPTTVDMTLRIMPLNGGKIEVLAKFLGNGGGICAPCWSPDSQRVAFVSQQLQP